MYSEYTHTGVVWFKTFGGGNSSCCELLRETSTLWITSLELRFRKSDGLCPGSGSPGMILDLSTVRKKGESVNQLGDPLDRALPFQDKVSFDVSDKLRTLHRFLEAGSKDSPEYQTIKKEIERLFPALRRSDGDELSVL